MRTRLDSKYRLHLRLLVITVFAACLTGGGVASAGPLGFFGPPAEGDPSAFTGPLIGLEFAGDILETLPPGFEGSFEGSTHEAAGENNAVPPAQQQATNVPTNGKPSPLFGAQSFTQQMLVFEEFGPERLDPMAAAPAGSFPVPTVGPAPGQDPHEVAMSGPEGAALEAFLAQGGIAPFPMEFSNTLAENPWKLEIEHFLGRELHAPPAEGRPAGRGWAHQRWNEFLPQAFFKTAQAGARVNGGFRDSKQMHHYSVGEFGPGGLYHRVFGSSVPGAPTLDGTTKGIAIQIHPLMPVQEHKALWTFDGTLPPKLLMVRYGQPVLMRHYNALPIDPAANRGFGLHTISTHEHNGHSPAESDGYANAFFFPGQFYDYRWTLQLAGYDSINTSATDPRAAFPCSPGETLFVNDANPGLKTCTNGSIKIRGDWRETMSTHWFHDHMLDFTAQNVYKGNAVMMNYYSALGGQDDQQRTRRDYAEDGGGAATGFARMLGYARIGLAALPLGAALTQPTCTMTGATVPAAAPHLMLEAWLRHDPLPACGEREVTRCAGRRSGRCRLIRFARAEDCRSPRSTPARGAGSAAGRCPGRGRRRRWGCGAPSRADCRAQSAPSKRRRSRSLPR
jgi:hypothetical protein